MSSPDIDFSKDSPALLSIGEVLVRLRNEFEDISISKIRFLESNGLVSPERTASGYRKFSLVDVERLRYVLRMQRDHFLPLRVIKEHIDALNRGLQPVSVGDTSPKPPRALISTQALDVSNAASAVRMNRLELIADTQSDPEFLDQLVEFGLVKPDSQGYFSLTASAVVSLALALRGFGLEPRHLKTVLSSASREVDLFAPLVKSAAAQRTPAAGAQAEELSLQLASLIISLHGLLVREVIDRQA
ncbi:MAG: MerR family transcriptional regulator [Actinomycetes bacterium]